MRRRYLFSAVLGFAMVASGATVRAAAAEDFGRYLPAATSFDAEYVVEDYDPVIQQWSLTMQAAMQADPAWFRHYQDQHPDQSPPPWHPRYGITQAQHERLLDPSRHFVEVSRQRIRVKQLREGAVIRLELQGQDLLLNAVTFDGATASATTARATLPLRERVEAKRLKTPPAGFVDAFSFRTPDEQVSQLQSREFLALERFTDTANKGFIRYSIEVPGKRAYSYVTFAMKGTRP